MSYLVQHETWRSFPKSSIVFRQQEANIFLYVTQIYLSAITRFVYDQKILSNVPSSWNGNEKD